MAAPEVSGTYRYLRNLTGGRAEARGLDGKNISEHFMFFVRIVSTFTGSRGLSQASIGFKCSALESEREGQDSTDTCCTFQERQRRIVASNFALT